MFSRRQFLTVGGSILAGMLAGLGAGQWRGLQRALAGGEDCEPGADATPVLGVKGERPLVVALLSDTHVRAPGDIYVGHFNTKLKQAVEDLRPFHPDLWIVNGDVADHGKPLEFSTFQQIMGRRGADDGLLVTAGNHEFYDRTVSDEVARQRFQNAFGLPHSYSNHVIGGLHIVMLADEQWKSAPRNPDWAWLSQAQVEWLDRVLAENQSLFTLVFLHQPLQQTVAGTYVDDGFAGSGQVDQLKAIVARNPQVRLWFSGHTHHRLEMDNQVVQQGTTWFTALGSTCYLYRPDPGYPGGLDEPPGWRKDWTLSESRVLEVWPDRVVIRSRDHAARRWLGDLEFTLRR